MPRNPDTYTTDDAMLFADVIVAAFGMMDIPTDNLADEMEITEFELVEILNDAGMDFDLDDFEEDDG